jgi:hypothetical protein
LLHAKANEGTRIGLRDAGYYAIDGLRLEKGYRAWGSDITPDDTPLEAGLGFAVDLKNETKNFLGKVNATHTHHTHTHTHHTHTHHTHTLTTALVLPTGRAAEAEEGRAREEARRVCDRQRPGGLSSRRGTHLQRRYHPSFTRVPRVFCSVRAVRAVRALFSSWCGQPQGKCVAT